MITEEEIPLAKLKPLAMPSEEVMAIFYATASRHELKDQSHFNKKLIEACKNNSPENVLLAFHNGAHPDAIDTETKKNAFSIVGTDNKWKFKPRFSKRKAFEALMPSIKLCKAAYHGNLDKVNEVLDNKDIFPSKSVLTAALNYALLGSERNEGNLDEKYENICRKLLERGANPNLAFSPGEKTIMEKIFTKNSYSPPKIKQLFLKHAMKEISKERDKQKKEVLKNPTKRKGNNMR